MTYVLNKSLEKNEGLELYSPGGICHLCPGKREELQHCTCNGALKGGGYCEECQLDMQILEKSGCEKAAVYELLGKQAWWAGQRKFLQGFMKNILHT